MFACAGQMPDFDHTECTLYREVSSSFVNKQHNILLHAKPTYNANHFLFSLSHSFLQHKESSHDLFIVSLSLIFATTKTALIKLRIN